MPLPVGTKKPRSRSEYETSNSKFVSLVTCAATPAGKARFAYRICLFAAVLSVPPAAVACAADLNQNLKASPPVIVAPLIVAQATNSKSAKGAPQASPVAPNPSGAEIVGKMLSTQPSDPDVPLPRSDLATRPAGDGPLDRTTIYGRQEGDGGVLGFKIPIPADRNASDRHTRSGGGGSGAN